MRKRKFKIKNEKKKQIYQQDTKNHKMWPSSGTKVL